MAKNIHQKQQTKSDMVLIYTAGYDQAGNYFLNTVT